MRTVRLIVPILLLFVLGFGCGESGPPTRPDYNVLFISLDTVRADHLGCYGYERDTSPAIDTLAAKSFQFQNAFSHSPKTTPSHMSMFTSLLPTVHGVYLETARGKVRPYQLDHKIKTLAQYYQERGFKTAAFHGGGNVAAEYGFNRGFGSDYILDNAWKRPDQWIRQHLDDRFFLFLHTYKAHDPYQPPPPYSEMFTDPNYAGRITAQKGKDWWDIHRRYWSLVDKNSPADIDELIGLYDGCIRLVDDKMLRPLLATLEETGLMDNTIIVLLSDHGEEFMEHGGVLHEKLYDETLQVPLLIYLPPDFARHFEGPRQIDAQVPLIDVMPTLLDLMRIPFEPSLLQGQSLRPYLVGEENADRAVVSTRFNSNSPDPQSLRYRSLRNYGYKLIENWRTGPEPDHHELYDIRTDPGEQANLAPEGGTRLERLRDALEDLAEQNRVRRQMVNAELTPAEFEQSTMQRLKDLGYVE